MVRFKHFSPQDYSLKGLVSIPLWFDSNLTSKWRSIKKSPHCLNSTMVRFKPYQNRLDQWVVQGLNSTMVRFKLSLSDYNINELTTVSIPLWFDSNFKRPQPIEVEAKTSQFHYGSIQTSCLHH